MDAEQPSEYESGGCFNVCEPNRRSYIPGTSKARSRSGSGEIISTCGGVARVWRFHCRNMIRTRRFSAVLKTNPVPVLQPGCLIRRPNHINECEPAQSQRFHCRNMFQDRAFLTILDTNQSALFSQASNLHESLFLRVCPGTEDRS